MSEKWDDVSEIQTEGVRLHDEQTGQAIILRQFKFAYHPLVTKKPKKSEILTKEYIKHLENMLWADALELVADPRLHFHKGGFTIFAPCVPKRGNMIPYEALETMNTPLHKRIIDDKEPQ